jgi:hypothetical protein
MAEKLAVTLFTRNFIATLFALVHEMSIEPLVSVLVNFACIVHTAFFFSKSYSFMLTLSATETALFGLKKYVYDRWPTNSEKLVRGRKERLFSNS